MRLAVVDVGSNSTRLLLCSRIGDEGPEGGRDTEITGLVRGAGRDGSVSDAALGRLRAVLRRYRARIDAFRPDRTLAVGTSAVRDAPNRDLISDVVREALDAELRVIDGETEADLAYRGARLAAPEGPAAVVDIGGGSTEVVRGDGPTRLGAVSLPRGAVRCTEAYLAADPPTPDALARLRRALEEEIERARRAIGGGEGRLIGVAGTFTSLAAVDIGRYDPRLVHGHRLPKDRLRAIVDRLARLPLAERRVVPGLHPRRAPHIVAGGEIGLAALAGLGAAAVEVSERDILDGIALAGAEGWDSSRL